LLPGLEGPSNLDPVHAFQRAAVPLGSDPQRDRDARQTTHGRRSGTVDAVRRPSRRVAPRVVWRICFDPSWWSLFGRSRGKRLRVGSRLDDLVCGDITAIAGRSRGRGRA
jgi:hypothetical protein